MAGALTGVIRSKVELKCRRGGGAVNQAVKAIAIARGYLAPSGIGFGLYPRFVDVKIDDTEKLLLGL